MCVSANFKRVLKSKIFKFDAACGNRLADSYCKIGVSGIPPVTY